MPSRILGAMSVLVTEGLFPKFLFWRKITHAGPIDRGRLPLNIIMPPPGFSLIKDSL